MSKELAPIKAEVQSTIKYIPICCSDEHREPTEGCECFIRETIREKQKQNG